MSTDTHGLFQDTMKRIRMEIGMWIQRMVFSKTTAQSSQKLAEFTILCDIRDDEKIYSSMNIKLNR